MTTFNYWLALLLGGLLFSCSPDSQKELKVQEGMAFGTEYKLQYFGEYEGIESAIDSVVQRVNQSMSNYQEDSDISRLNSGDTTIVVDELFREVFLLAKEIYGKTEGYFDPTVGNLVNAYGFGAQKLTIALDSIRIDSLMQYVGFDKVEISDSNRIIREDPNIYIDLNGIAKGYAVDLFAELLEAERITNYLVEIGGEMRAKGKNLKSNRNWRLGIDDPRIEGNQNELQGVLELVDKGMATSGNYRKYRTDSISGEQYVHIVNPKTGYREKRSILSASVLAEDVATADAYATAFMAMDIEKALEIAQKQSDIEVFFIYSQDKELKTYLSAGFKEALVE